MAKQLGNIEIVIRGSASGPTKAFIRYLVQDSVNTELRTKKEHEIVSPDFNKILHDAGAAGELWKDEVAAAEAAERI